MWKKAEIVRVESGPTGPMSDADREAFARVTQQITACLGAWRTMGEAFAELREGRYYRETHDSWQAFVRDRWGITANSANRAIRAVAFARLGNSTPAAEAIPLITSQRQALALSRAEPSLVPDVMARAKSMTDGALTEKIINIAVAACGRREEPPLTPIDPYRRYDLSDSTVPCRSTAMQRAETAALATLSEQRELALRMLKKLADLLQTAGAFEPFKDRFNELYGDIEAAMGGPE